MRIRLYDTALGFALGLCVMGLFALWQADQIRNWERLYAEQDYEIQVHRDYATAKARLASQLSIKLCERQTKIDDLTAELEQRRTGIRATALE